MGSSRGAKSIWRGKRGREREREKKTEKTEKKAKKKRRRNVVSICESKIVERLGLVDSGENQKNASNLFQQRRSPAHALPLLYDAHRHSHAPLLLHLRLHLFQQSLPEDQAVEVSPDRQDPDGAFHGVGGTGLCGGDGGGTDGEGGDAEEGAVPDGAVAGRSFAD